MNTGSKHGFNFWQVTKRIDDENVSVFLIDYSVSTVIR
jgi:hypothetical protein